MGNVASSFWEPAGVGISYQSKNYQSRDPAQCSKKRILLIGNAGSGKSSFVNSMYTAVSGSYVERAMSGGPAGHVSKILFKKYDLSQGAFEPQTKMFKKDQLPVFYEMPGLQPNDSVSKRFEEVLKVILRGRLPVHTKVLDLLSNEEEIPECDDGKPIERVVFVAAANEELPSVFCNSVMKVCEEVMGAEVTVFGILTKWDLLTTTDEQKRKYDEFLEMMHACDTSYKALYVSNYCMAVCGASPASWSKHKKIDNPLLTFLAEICRPEYDP